MSDRHNGFIIIFDTPIKDEDSEYVKSLLLMLKNVISVQPIVDDVPSMCIRSQERHKLKMKLYNVLNY